MTRYRVRPGGMLQRLVATPMTVRTLRPDPVGPDDVKIAPHQRAVYVADGGHQEVAQYRIDAHGHLSPFRPAYVDADSHPNEITIDPTGRFAYVVCSHGALLNYAIRQDGSLRALFPRGVSVRVDPRDVGVAPGGHWLFVSSDDSEEDNIRRWLSSFHIRSNGTIDERSRRTVSVGQIPARVVFAPRGRVCYLISNPEKRQGSITAYRLTTRGALIPVAGAVIRTGHDPAAITFDPAGHYAYVVNGGDQTVGQYRISADGYLTPSTPSTVATGREPSPITVDATGRFVYIINDQDRTISEYKIMADGRLARLPSMA